MLTEKFKGDDTELKFDATFAAVFDQTSVAKDQFLSQGFDASPFILMLYGERRIPFSERVKQEAFVEFYKEVLKRFPFVGTFDSYIFILTAIFGAASEITFDVTGPGVLEIDVNADSTLVFDFIGRDELGDTFEMIDDVGNILEFRGLAGIETVAELELLFSEIMPAGISPHISLSFYSKYIFIGEDGVGEFEVLDNLGNNIVFTELGV